MNGVGLFAMAVGLIAVNGLFVAVEFSLLASRRSRIEEWAEEGRMGAVSALAGMRTLNMQLAASQLGITVCSLLLGWLIEPVVGSGFERLFDGVSVTGRTAEVVSVILALVIVALFHMVLGEMVPKSVALAAPERTAVVLVPLHRAFTLAVRPVVRVLYRLGYWGTRALGVQPIDELLAAHTPAELAAMVEEAREGEIDPAEHGLLAGALGFLGVRSVDVMAPRDDLVIVPATATVAEAEELMHRSGHSRVLVAGDGDSIKGFLHAKDLLKLPSTARSGLLPGDLVRRALRVRPDDRLPDLLPRMRRGRRHVAVVVDDEQRVVGLVTLEDILEAIVGDIRDETDRAGDERGGLRTDDQLATELAAVLSDRAGREVTVDGLRRLSGGASRGTWSFVAADAAGQRPLILQRERVGGIRAARGMAVEGALLQAAASASVPVPGVVATDEGGDELGAPFLIVEHVDGETIPRRLLRDEAYASARSLVTAQAGAALAAVHRIDPADVTGLDEADQVDQFTELLDSLGQPHPAFELGLRWLRTTRPEPVPAGVVHGDFRTGNLIVDPTGLRAVLDWELAHLGDPIEDLGWFCVRAWRFGSPHRAGGFGSADELVAAYEAAGGAPVEPARLQWWEAMGTLKWGVMCIVQAATHWNGLSRSVELAAIGRRAAEQEEDLLELIAGPCDYLPDDAADGSDTAGPYDRPTASELLEAVEEYLASVREEVPGRLGFHARVAGNVVATVGRELALGPAQRVAHADRLASLGVADDHELASLIRSGAMDDRWDEVAAVVRRTVRDKLAVSHPGYWLPNG